MKTIVGAAIVLMSLAPFGAYADPVGPPAQQPRVITLPQQPVMRQPMSQPLAAQQPIAQQPLAQQPIAQQPIAQQPVALEQQADPADAAPAQPDAPPPVDRSAQQAVGAPSASAAHEAQAGDERDQAIFSRLKGLVKKLDAANRKGIQFPSKPVEAAIRAEFLRRTEGNHGLAWLKGKHLRDADRTVAMDNLELLISYSERLATARIHRGKAKLKPAELNEMKLLAAKGVIDHGNTWAKNGHDRGIASLGERPAGLSKVGKAEAARRKRLVAGLIAGEDYSPIQVKKVDDYGKRLKALLSQSTKEYDKFALLVAKSSASADHGHHGAKKAKKAKKHHRG